MTKYTVVRVDARQPELPAEAAELAQADAELVAINAQSDDEVIEAARNAHGLLIAGRQTGRNIFEACPELRVAVRYGIGFDVIDVEAASEHGVVVCNITDYCLDEVANHAFALLLALNRKLRPLDTAIRDGEREPLGPCGGLRDETLGLVAFGHIAQEVARRAQPFGLRVIAYDPYVGAEPAAGMGVQLVSLDEVMRESDYISVHPPLNEETRGLVGAEQLALMKPSAQLVTTCRGGVVDEGALYDALQAERIAGAGIDVWVEEPVQPEHPLLELPNVIATPHSAYYSNRSSALLPRRVGEAAADVLRGYLPRNVVNRQVLDLLALQPHPDR